MNAFIQSVISGIAVGAIYALVALGYNIIFSTTRILNLAQGEFVAIGALMSYQLEVELKWPVPLAILTTVAVLIVAGYIVEKLVMIPTRLAGSSFGWIISTIAAAIVIRNILTLPFLPFGTDSHSPPPLVAGTIRLGDIGINWQNILVLVFAVLIVVALEIFMSRTFTGKAIQATSNNGPVASLMGINVKRMITFSFVLSAVVTGLAGVLIGPITGADANMGIDLGVKGFVAAVVGGMGSARGAVLGGFLIGLLQTLSAWFFGSVINLSSGSASYANIAVYAALAVVLLANPEGLAGLRFKRRPRPATVSLESRV
jgi:branched-chain amino acid transport system permease protein